MGFLSSIFGGGGSTSQTTYVSTSTNVTVSPNIANVIELGPLQKLIDTLTLGQSKTEQLYGLAVVSQLAATQAKAESDAKTAGVIGGALDSVGKNFLFAGAAVAVVWAATKWGK